MTREEAINHLGTYRFRGINHTTAEFIPAPDVWQEAMNIAIAALREQPQWISVEERLPVIKDSEPWGELVEDKGYRFLVADGDGYVFTENFWIKANRFGDPSVTHWMPLPEAPEVEV